MHILGKDAVFSRVIFMLVSGCLKVFLCKAEYEYLSAVVALAMAYSFDLKRVIKSSSPSDPTGARRRFSLDTCAQAFSHEHVMDVES